MTDKQQRIDVLFSQKHNEYNDIRNSVVDENDKLYRMDLFYIDNLKIIFDCLKENVDIKLINIERFSRNNGEDGHMYVPCYLNKDNEYKISKVGYPYKATALLKLLYGFTSYLEEEKLK